jgi:hypothetical protein
MKSELLLEELKRINTVMNYKVGEPSTKNNNNLFESRFKEMLISKLESIHIIEEQKKNDSVLSEQWARGKDSIGYWKILYDQLKKAGIDVKYGANGKQVTDPTKSSFMYWSGWIINYSLSANGGYPVSFTDSAANVSMTFKFQGGKYAGQPAANIILEPKTITSTFNLGQFGKLSNKRVSDVIAKYKKTNPKAVVSNQPTQQDLNTAQTVFDELKKAFDGGGTYEDDAITAFNKIKNKPTLDRLNQLVKARKMSGINSVYDWLTDEMSDYDYKQYRTIWDKLKSIDKTLVAPKVNNALRVASVVGDVTGINAAVSVGEGIGKAIQTLKNMTVGDIMEGFRSFLGGVAGGVVQILLTVFGGPLGAGINLFAWAVLLIWDIYQWTQGKPNWWNLILDTFSVVTAGLAAKALAPAKAVASEAKTLPLLMSALKKGFPTVYKYVAGFGGTLVKLGGKAVTGVKNALGWLSSKLPFFSTMWNKLNGMISKIGDLVKSLDDAIGTAVSGKVISSINNKVGGFMQKSFPKLGEFFKSPKGIELAKKLTEKEADAIGEYISGPIRGKTIEASTEWVCKNGTKAQCDAFKGGNEYYKIAVNVSKVGKSGTEINSTVKKKEGASELVSKTAAHLGATKEIVPGEEEKKP